MFAELIVTFNININLFKINRILTGIYEYCVYFDYGRSNGINDIFAKIYFLNSKAITLMVPITDQYSIFLEIKNDCFDSSSKETKIDTYYYNYTKLLNTV